MQTTEDFDETNGEEESSQFGPDEEETSIEQGEQLENPRPLFQIMNSALEGFKLIDKL